MQYRSLMRKERRNTRWTKKRWWWWSRRRRNGQGNSWMLRSEECWSRDLDLRWACSMLHQSLLPPPLALLLLLLSTHPCCHHMVLDHAHRWVFPLCKLSYLLPALVARFPCFSPPNPPLSQPILSPYPPFPLP